MNKDYLKQRTVEFSLSIIALLESLPSNYIYQIIGRQLLRSATSIGANIIEAQAGSSRKDFINFYHIALKSANETQYWLMIIIRKIPNENKKERVLRLLQENQEICKILTASLKTLKNIKLEVKN